MIAESHVQIATAASDVVIVVAVAPDDRETLDRLLQSYQYDFSAIEPSEVSTNGRFHQLDEVAFQHAYFVNAAGALAGLAPHARTVRLRREGVRQSATARAIAAFCHGRPR